MTGGLRPAIGSARPCPGRPTSPAPRRPSSTRHNDQSACAGPTASVWQRKWETPPVARLKGGESHEPNSNPLIVDLVHTNAIVGESQPTAPNFMRRSRFGVTYPLSANHRAESSMAAEAGREV